MCTSFSTTQGKVVLGIDIGTSGVRGVVVDKSQSHVDKIICRLQVYLPTAQFNPVSGECKQAPSLWLQALKKLLSQVSKQYNPVALTHLVLDATSSTVLLTNSAGKPITDALMYNDSHALEEAEKLAHFLSSHAIQTGASGASSTLVKVLRLLQDSYHIPHSDSDKATNRQPLDLQQTPHIMHQIDYLNYYLTGIKQVTDENNALKLSYDSVQQKWPEWVQTQLHQVHPNVQLPKVVPPGTFLGKLRPELAQQFKLPDNLHIMTGTTDSIAGFLAAGAKDIGDAVTSLGSTIAIKVLSDTPIFSGQMGLYSHKLGQKWLVGGASNCGGKVFLKYYSIKQLKGLLQTLKNNPEWLEQLRQTYSKHAFYPLCEIGERFPVADPQCKPVIPKMPNQKLTDSSSQENIFAHLSFVYGLALGLAQVEKDAYEKLTELGVPAINRLYSVGGGVENMLWMQLRAERLACQQLCTGSQQEAAYGVTKLI